MPSSGGYTVKCVEDIINIPDMSTARGLLKDWGIETKGLKNKDEAIARLLDFWKLNNGQIRKQPAEKYNGLKEAILADKHCRNKLRDKYDELYEYYKKLPPNYQQDLNGVFPNVEQTILQRKQEVMSPECTLLIAGEKSSGKSSFINLLLETDILPTDQLKCTTTFVELRKSGKDNRKSAVVHHKTVEGERRRRQPLIMELDDPSNLSKLHGLMKIDDDGESPIEKIEVYWPFSNLEEGIVLVDTPGVGESRNMSKLVEKYLCKSFGFIYVINTANAGGIQGGRLRDLLRQVVSSADEDFNPKAAMFVANKWDQVPDKDKDDVERTTLTKLSQYYPGVRPDQIHYMSVTEAKKAHDYGDMTEANKAMLEGMQRLLPTSLRNKLNVHYRFMSQILKRSLYSVKVAKVMAVRGIEEQQDKMKALERQMEALERNARYSVEDLRKGIEFEMENLYKNTADVLRSKAFAERMYSWSEKDCARPDKDWNRVSEEAYERIASRLSCEINVWERNNKIIVNLKEKIVKKFKRDFALMEDQIQQIEGALVAGETRIVSDLHKSVKKHAPVRQLWKKARKDEDEEVKGLGGVITSVGSLGSDKNRKAFFKAYKKEDCRKRMCEATEIFIHSIFEGDELKNKLRKYLQRFVKGIDMVAKMIPEFIEADRQLMKNIKAQMADTKGNLHEVFPALLRRATLLQGNLDMFFVYNIMEMDYRLRDLEYTQHDIVGSGSFANVYKAKLRCHPHMTTTVALKVTKDAIDDKNISDILLEDRTLRELKHDSVVRYYGSVCREEGGKGRNSKVFWIMIMEFCSDTLKSVFLDPEFDNPGKMRVRTAQLKAMQNMAKYVVKICDGLEYIHAKGLVHRDLKLENILVTADDEIKHADVGLTKRQDQIAASVVGSPVYMAPEVLLQKGIYNRKADIYSIGIILWEMWYGMDAANYMEKQIFGSLQQTIEQGVRPSLSLETPPPQDWEKMIKSCWDYEPTARPEAKEIKEFFRGYTK